MTAAAAAIIADPGSRDTGLAPVQAPVDRVVAELGAAPAERARVIQVAAAAPLAPPATRAREYARVVAHFERVLGATPEAKAAVPSAERTTPQPEGDRSDAVIALLLAAGPDTTVPRRPSP